MQSYMIVINDLSDKSTRYGTVRLCLQTRIVIYRAVVVYALQISKHIGVFRRRSRLQVSRVSYALAPPRLTRRRFLLRRATPQRLPVTCYTEYSPPVKQFIKIQVHSATPECLSSFDKVIFFVSKLSVSVIKILVQ